jgi:tyrosinase
MKFTRKNAYDANNGGQFLHLDGSYTDLYWYAVAVGVMKSRPISDATSWWFYGAIHGEYLLKHPIDFDKTVLKEGYPNWKDIPSIPVSADLSSMDKPNDLTDIFWNQCQHGTWYFLPWHRGYLVAIEDILRGIIVSLGGPSDWTLPYWNYFKPNQEYIPPAFMQENLPDHSPNPLYIAERYGPTGKPKENGVYVELSGENEITEQCQEETVYVNGGTGYGGDITSFWHGGSPHFHGELESDPHDTIHVMTGGFRDIDPDDDDANRGIEGLMTDPSTAALDPIFYVHHCNIDRMWAAWNETGKRLNPIYTAWLDGPAHFGSGQRDFTMPIDKAGTKWKYAPKDVNNTIVEYYNGKYEYTFDDLSLTSGKQDTLAATHEQEQIKVVTTMGTNNNPELVGASNSLTLNSGMTKTIVQVDKASSKEISKGFLAASSSNPPSEVYLQLEGVTGVNNSNMLAVYLNDIFVKSVALFGISNASMDSDEHGGAGLSFRFNISHIIEKLSVDGDFEDNLNVQIKTRNQIMGKIKIGRISIYRLN